MVEVFIDALTGDIVSTNDFVAHATYRVNPVGRQDPRTGLEVVVNPELAAASPNGWSATGDTEGNNCIGMHVRRC
jgi:extracellular elastinolytic metalloproteinase